MITTDIFEVCTECRARLTTKDTHATLCRWCEFYDTYNRVRGN